MAYRIKEATVKTIVDAANQTLDNTANQKRSTMPLADDAVS